MKAYKIYYTDGSVELSTDVVGQNALGTFAKLSGDHALSSLEKGVQCIILFKNYDTQHSNYYTSMLYGCDFYFGYLVNNKLAIDMTNAGRPDEDDLEHPLLRRLPREFIKAGVRISEDDWDKIIRKALQDKEWQEQ